MPRWPGVVENDVWDDGGASQKALGPVQPVKRRVRGICVRMLLGGLIGLSRVLPMRAAERLGAALGDLIFWCVPRYRSVARRNLAVAFGWEAPRVEVVAHQVFRNIGKTLIEFLRLPALSPAEIRQFCHLEGFEHIRAGLAAGRGVLLVT